jgi:hypothetical protein
MRERVETLRRELIEAAVESDDELLEKYLGTHDLSEADVRRAIRKATISQLGQLPRIANPGQQGPNDRQPGHSTEIAYHIGQLHVHAGEGFLHLLDGSRRLLHPALSQPPNRPYGSNLLRWPNNP